MGKRLIQRGPCTNNVNAYQSSQRSGTGTNQGGIMIGWYLSKNEQEQRAEQNAKLGHGWRLRSISMHGAAADPSFAAVWVQASGPVQTVVICDIAKLDQVIEDAAKKGTHPTLVTGVGDSRSVCRVLVVFEPGTKASVVGPWTKLWFDPGNLLADDGEAGIKMRAGNSCAGLIAVRDGADTFVRALWMPSDPQRAPLQWFEVDRQDRLNEAVQVMRPHRARLLNTFLVSDPPQRIMLWDDPAFDQVHTFGMVAHDTALRVEAEEKKGNVPLRISAGEMGGVSVYDVVFAKPDAKLPDWTFRKSANPFGAGVANPFSAIDDYIKDFMVQRGIRVMQFAAADKGRLGYGRAYTWAEDDFPTAKATDLCEIGSTTKAITATAIMLLVQNLHPAFPDGVNTKVYDILKGSSTPWRNFTGDEPSDPRFHKLTLDHLLSMVTGFGGFGANQSDPEIDALIKATIPGATVHHPITKAQSMAYMAQRDADAFDGTVKPGEICAYANMAFVVLGRVLEAVTGVPYLTFVRDSIFGPLGVPAQRIQIGSVKPGENGELLYHTARPMPIDAWAHVNPAPGAPRPLVYPPYEGDGHTFDAHGALAMSIIDITRFCSSFKRGAQGPELLTKDGLKDMWSFKDAWKHLPGTNGTNLRGWNTAEVDGHTYYMHNGGTGGAESISGVMEDGMAFGVLLATNTEGDGFGGAQLDWVSHELHAIRDAGSWPATDLFEHFGVTDL
jgi:CubicO group peptidase (beta-lactamase class C family)